MRKTRRTKITIETERLVVISRRRSFYSLCSMCGDETRMVTVDEASALTRVNSREIYRRVEAGELHFIETAEGALLICLNSLNDSNLNQKG